MLRQWIVCCAKGMLKQLHICFYFTILHLLFGSVFWWLGLILILPPNLSSLFECLTSAATCKKIKEGYCLIWLTTICLICKSRSDRIFSNRIKDPIEVVDDVQVWSWRWSLSKMSFSRYLYYEWFWDPSRCMVSWASHTRGDWCEGGCFRTAWRLLKFFGLVCLVRMTIALVQKELQQFFDPWLSRFFLQTTIFTCHFGGSFGKGNGSFSIKECCFCVIYFCSDGAGISICLEVVGVVISDYSVGCFGVQF